MNVHAVPIDRIDQFFQEQLHARKIDRQDPEFQLFLDVCMPPREKQLPSMVSVMKQHLHYSLDVQGAFQIWCMSC